MSLKKVRNILAGTGLDVPRNWTWQQQQQWSLQVDIILQAAAEMERSVMPDNRQLNAPRETRGNKRKRKRQSDTDKSNSRPAMTTTTKASTNGNGDGGGDTRARNRPSRRAKLEAIGKLREFSNGSGKSYCIDGKFQGVTYPTRTRTS